MDLSVAPLEYHEIILVLELIKLAKVFQLSHESHLVLLDEARTPSAPLTMKRKPRMMPIIYLIMLGEVKILAM